MVPMMDRRGFLRVAGAARTALVAGCSTTRPSESGATNATTSDSTAAESTTDAPASTSISISTSMSTSMSTSTSTWTSSTEAPTTSAPVTTTSQSTVSTVLATTNRRRRRFPQPVPPPSVPASLDELAAMIHGRVVRRCPLRRHAIVQNTRPDDIRPAAIVVVEDAGDVALAIRFANAQGLPFAVRSGGHSYCGWSGCPGIVIDVRSLAGVLVDASSGTVVIGAGAALIDVYSILARSHVAIAAWSCPTVGIAGPTLGGGHGLTGRAFGLTFDQMRSVEIVTADGTVHRCDASTDADFFWACRGGGGEVSESSRASPSMSTRCRRVRPRTR